MELGWCLAWVIDDEVVYVVVAKMNVMLKNMN
jgi:hypothetical protein